MNKSIVDIIDYVITEHEYFSVMNTISHIQNRYDIEVDDNIVEYILMNK